MLLRMRNTGTKQPTAIVRHFSSLALSVQLHVVHADLAVDIEDFRGISPYAYPQQLPFWIHMLYAVQVPQQARTVFMTFWPSSGAHNDLDAVTTVRWQACKRTEAREYRVRKGNVASH